jgi:hypothetical protein
LCRSHLISTPPKIHTALTKIVGPLSVFSLIFLPSTPPKIDVEATLTLTPSGKIISIPPKIDVVVITTSFLILASLKSNLIPPKIAFKLVPLNSSATLISCPENVANTSSPTFSTLTKSLEILFLNISDKPIPIIITGTINFQITSKSITF